MYQPNPNLSNFIESDRLEIHGTPSQGVIERMREITGSGVALSYNPKNLGGYIRPKSG